MLSNIAIMTDIRKLMYNPITKKEIHITADMPEHMERTWATFGWEVKYAPVDPFEAYK